MRAIALKARVPPLFLREQYKGLGFWFGAQVIDATILSLLFLLITNMILRTVFAHAWTTPPWIRLLWSNYLRFGSILIR
jgi:hypothetical protein